MEEAIPPIITVKDFERQIKHAFVVHIAGKGNMPTKPEDVDLTKYTTYVKNYGKNSDSPYDSFGMQIDAFEELDDKVEIDFTTIIGMVSRAFTEANKEVADHNETMELKLARRAMYNSSEGPAKFEPMPAFSRIVYTFDGDNFQENSPFTKGIRMLVWLGYDVYGFKSTPPTSSKHFDSWVLKANAKYTALVSLGDPDRSPKDYTRERCNAYVSYGYPILARILQPQKDDEIKDGKDKYKRLPPSGQTITNGLVRSSMSSELSTAFMLQFRKMTDSHKYPRFLMLSDRIL